MFLRDQMSPYHIEASREFRLSGCVFRDAITLAAMKLQGPTPHGRNACNGDASDWGPDEIGYTDFDDYHLAVYGA